MQSLYLDIDGVILTSHHTQPAPGAEDLIDLAVNHFDCYWLTSYGKDGDLGFALRLLTRYFDKATMEKLNSIKPTNWRRLKTEGIDLDSDFVWLDDAPRDADRQVLEEHGKLDKLIVVDLNRPRELYHIIDYLGRNA